MSLEKMVTKQFNPLYRHMFQDYLQSGGSTYSYEGKKTEGYAVGGYAKCEYRVPVMDWTASDQLLFTNYVRRVVEEYEHLLAKGNYYVGTWFDRTNISLVIDIVKVFQHRDIAMMAAKTYNQKMIYNLEDKRYILVPSDKEYNEGVIGDGC